MSTKSIPKKDRWFYDKSSSILKDRTRLIESYIDYMFARTSRMFEYEGLPDYIPIREIEKILQFGGFIFFKKVDDKIFGFYGFLGGLRNAYYEPTSLLIANPYLREFSENEVNNLEDSSKDGVLMWNDSAHVGLSPLHERYATLIADADITIRNTLINARIPFLMWGEDEDDIDAINKFYEDIEEGSMIGIKTKKNLLSDEKNITAQSIGLSNQSTFKELIEVRQYYFAGWFNELGIDANYNMKREAISQGEIDKGTEILKPLVDDMLYCRKEGFKKFKEMFGIDVNIDYSSIWEARKHVSTFLPEGEEEDVIDENMTTINKDESKNEVEEKVEENKDES